MPCPGWAFPQPCQNFIPYVDNLPDLEYWPFHESPQNGNATPRGGFLHHRIQVNPDGTSTAPSQLPNAERKQRITETWQKHLAKFPATAKRPAIAHRLVFSISKEQHDALTDAGINPDQVLHSTMKKVMRSFNERFHPNDSIGYAYGLHHDTANLHVHVAICPRTENGSSVGCSTSRSSQSKQPIRHNNGEGRRSWQQSETLPGVPPG